MSYMCDICGKRPEVGNNVSHANNHTKRRWNSNVQRISVMEQGVQKHLYVCAKCIKTRQKAAR